MDRHKIWRLVRANLEHLNGMAPDGYEAVVDVYVRGREAPVRLNRVETTREPDFPWVLLLDAAGAEEGESRFAQNPALKYIFTPEQHVVRIEISFDRPTGQKVRFGFGDLDAGQNPDPSI